MKVYKYITILFLSFLVTKGYSQEWRVKTTSDFHYYFQSETLHLINRLDSVLSADLNELQKRLNYHTGSTIDVFIIDGIVHNYLASEDFESQVGPGDILLSPHRVVLQINQSTASISTTFRLSAAKLLIEEMMYGGTLQDKVKSANLINFPEWLLPGLNSYMAYGWSAELDNELRVVHDEIGLQDFNKIPRSYDAVKGASFWKYMEYKYGETAIPTLLYMSRFTRKFNSAIYYSFQTSFKDIFEGWQAYYNRAYGADQKKPNPIQGIQISSSELLEFTVVDEHDYYTLERSFRGVSLFYYNTISNKRSRLYTLSPSEVNLKPFSGSLVSSATGVQLVVNSPIGVMLHDFSSNGHTDRVLNLSFSTAVSQCDEGIILVKANLYESLIYLVSEKIKLIDSTSSYVNSYTTNVNISAWICEGKSGSEVFIRKGEVVTSLLDFDFKTRQLILANDSTLLFNSLESGIWNGNLFEINNGELFNVTNYRSNILGHQYTDKVFVEYVDRLELASLFITGQINSDDFYKYDTITPSFLSANLEELSFTKDINFTRNIDSLESYSFQTPVPDSRDFTTSNYDSLRSADMDVSQYPDIGIPASEELNAAFTHFKLTNMPEESEISAFKEFYPSLLPSNLLVKIGADYSNQYRTRLLGISYAGILQPGVRDIKLHYAVHKKQKTKLSFLHRKRTVWLDEQTKKLLSNNIQVKREKPISQNLKLSVSLIGSHNQSIPLQINTESLDLSPTQKVIIASRSDLHYKNQFRSHNFNFLMRVAPSYMVKSNAWNLSTSIDLRHIYKSKNGIGTFNKLSMGTSQGQLPIFYMLGGYSNDILISNNNRPFSDYKNPMLYENKYGIRGFDANYRNGNSYFLYTSEIESELISYLFNRPIVSEVFSNLRIVSFVDMGLSFYGDGIFNPANVLNTSTRVSSTRAIVTTVQAFKHPFISSFGGGFKTQIYGYPIRLDYAIGIEDQALLSGKFHLRIGFPY